MVKKVRELVKSVIFVFGPSGAGKGFGICDVFEEYHAGIAFITGDYCRNHQSEFSSSGALAPDDEMLEFALGFFANKIMERSGPIRLLVDMPRKQSQVESFMDMFKYIGYDGQFGSIILNVELDDTVDRLHDRAKRQSRGDDQKPEVIDRRVTGWFGSPLDQKLDKLGINRTLKRNQDGYVHTLIPWVEKNTVTINLNGQCLENLRRTVELQVPYLFNGLWGNN